MNDAVASREFRCISPSGEEFSSPPKVGRPFRVSDAQWGCAVSLEPLLDATRDIYGVDSWQALTLAMSLVHFQLRAFIERGGQLYYADRDSEQFMVDDFPDGNTRNA